MKQPRIQEPRFQLRGCFRKQPALRYVCRGTTSKTTSGSATNGHVVSRICSPPNPCRSPFDKLRASARSTRDSFSFSSSTNPVSGNCSFRYNFENQIESGAERQEDRPRTGGIRRFGGTPGASSPVPGKRRGSAAAEAAAQHGEEEGHRGGGGGVQEHCIDAIQVRDAACEPRRDR